MNDSSSRISAAQVVTLYKDGEYLGIAPVVEGVWHYHVDTLGAGEHSFSAKIATLTSNAWIVNIAHPQFLDFTNFENRNWNGWVKGPVGDETRIEPPILHPFWYAVNSTDRPRGYIGVALKKTLSGLTVGRRYEFKFKVSQYIYNVVYPCILSVSAGDVVVVPEFVPKINVWEWKAGVFTAVAPSVEMKISTHIDSGIGNDYLFTDITVTGL